MTHVICLQANRAASPKVIVLFPQLLFHGNTEIQGKGMERTAAIKRLEPRLNENVQSILLLGKHGLIVPTLMLVYSSIDIFASLTRENPERDVSRSDFVAWVGRYMLPIERSEVRAIDLYAARCGILHALSQTSRLSRNHEARELVYVRDRNEADKTKQQISSMHVVVEIPIFLNSYARAASSFLKSLEHDGILEKRVLANVEYIFQSE